VRNRWPQPPGYHRCKIIWSVREGEVTRGGLRHTRTRCQFHTGVQDPRNGDTTE
jgi:hypothetical protein